MKMSRVKIVTGGQRSRSQQTIDCWFKHVLFHLHEKGLGRAQMLCCGTLLTIVTLVLNNAHSCNNTLTLPIHANVTSIIPHVQNHEFVTGSWILIVTRSTQRVQTSLAEADHYSHIAHCKNVEPWLWKTTHAPKKRKKKVLDHYLHHDLDMLPLLRCFFCSFTLPWALYQACFQT